jgi:hypothetical protein
MTQLLARGVVRVFRLTNERGELGLSCTPAGVSLAGVPLLRRAQAEFVPRPASEVVLLLKAAYGKDLPGLRSRLGAIAQVPVIVTFSSFDAMQAKVLRDAVKE